jgi:hypothetical protein
VLLDHRKDREWINVAQVVVHQDVAKATDLPPGDVRVQGFLFVGQALCGFRQCLQIAQCRVIQNGVGRDIATRLDGADTLDGVKNVIGVGLPRLGSQRHGLGKHPCPDMAIQFVFGDHFDQSSGQFGQAFGQCQTLAE